MPMNSLSLHCMWSDRKSRLSLTRACEFFFFSQGRTYLVPVKTLFGPVHVPCGLVDLCPHPCGLCMNTQIFCAVAPR